jgi:hypothetical protein
MIAPGSRPLEVKFLLPALTEAASPYWRPIKYSLFPPLGLATLAAHLSPDDRAVKVDQHVKPLARMAKLAQSTNSVSPARRRQPVDRQVLKDHGYSGKRRMLIGSPRAG